MKFPCKKGYKMVKHVRTLCIGDTHSHTSVTADPPLQVEVVDESRDTVYHIGNNFTSSYLMLLTNTNPTVDFNYMNYPSVSLLLGTQVVEPGFYSCSLAFRNELATPLTTTPNSTQIFWKYVVEGKTPGSATFDVEAVDGATDGAGVEPPNPPDFYVHTNRKTLPLVFPSKVSEIRTRVVVVLITTSTLDLYRLIVREYRLLCQAQNKQPVVNMLP